MGMMEEIKKLSENDLRKKIIIPMLTALGGFKVTDFHGSRENGIDVYFAWKNILGDWRNCAVFLKKGDIKKSGSKRDIRIIKGAIEELFKNMHTFPTNPLDKSMVNEALVICSGQFNKEALEYISDLGMKNSFHNITFYDIDNICHSLKEILGEREFNIDTFHQMEGFKKEDKKMSGLSIADLAVPQEGEEIIS